MPIYEFECKTCGTHFEKLVNFSQASQPQQCPICHSQETEKQISRFAAQNFAPSFSSSGSSCNSGGGHFT